MMKPIYQPYQPESKIERSDKYTVGNDMKIGRGGMEHMLDRHRTANAISEYFPANKG